MARRRPQDGPRWPQEGPKMGQSSPNLAQWGGLPLRSAAPCLWQVPCVWNDDQYCSSPLWGNVIFPNPRTGTTYTIGLFFASCFTMVLLKRFCKCSPLPRRLPTLADFINPRLRTAILKIGLKAIILQVELVKQIS